MELASQREARADATEKSAPIVCDQAAMQGFPGGTSRFRAGKRFRAHRADRCMVMHVWRTSLMPCCERPRAPCAGRGASVCSACLYKESGLYKPCGHRPPAEGPPIARQHVLAAATGVCTRASASNTSHWAPAGSPRGPWCGWSRSDPLRPVPASGHPRGTLTFQGPTERLKKPADFTFRKGCEANGRKGGLTTLESGRKGPGKLKCEILPEIRAFRRDHTVSDA